MEILIFQSRKYCFPILMLNMKIIFSILLLFWKILVYFVENNISQKHIKMENKKPVKLTDFQKNEENPFMKQAIEGIENHVVKKYKSNSGGDKKAVVALADTETGEVFKTSFIRQIEVDEEQFTKLYLSNFAAFFDLSQAAIRVFGYFMTCMKPKNDLIIFNRKKCLEYTKYKTDKAVYKGLAELVKAEIIARGPADNLWFINPLIVFNGDRVTFAKTYVRKKTLAAQKKEEAKKRQLSEAWRNLACVERCLIPG